MNNDCPVCVQGHSTTTVIVVALLGMCGGAVLAGMGAWVLLLRAPMPPIPPRIGLVWRQPRTWLESARWLWFVVWGIGRHTVRKARQVHDNARSVEVANSNDATLPISTPKTRGRHV